MSPRRIDDDDWGWDHWGGIDSTDDYTDEARRNMDRYHDRRRLPLDSRPSPLWGEVEW